MLSLKEMRVRGDMIATYKIMSGKDKVDPGLLFDVGGEAERQRRDREVRSEIEPLFTSFSHGVYFIMY